MSQRITIPGPDKGGIALQEGCPARVMRSASALAAFARRCAHAPLLGPRSERDMIRRICIQPIIFSVNCKQVCRVDRKWRSISDAKWPYAGSRSAGTSWHCSRNCRHAWWASRRAPHRPIGPFGSQLQALKAQIPEFDRRIIAWHRSNATSKRLDAIPGVGPGNHVRRVRPDEPAAGISPAMRYDLCDRKRSLPSSSDV